MRTTTTSYSIGPKTSYFFHVFNLSYKSRGPGQAKAPAFRPSRAGTTLCPLLHRLPRPHLALALCPAVHPALRRLPQWALRRPPRWTLHLPPGPPQRPSLSSAVNPSTLGLRRLAVTHSTLGPHPLVVHHSTLGPRR